MGDDGMADSMSVQLHNIEEDEHDTLIVAEPGFRERLAAARRAHLRRQKRAPREEHFSTIAPLTGTNSRNNGTAQQDAPSRTNATHDL